MKKLFGVFASLALVFALVGCVMGQGAKGYKSAKEQIVAAEQKDDAKAKVKFTGGQFVHVEAQTLSGSILGFSTSSDVKEGWYYKITYTVTSGEGKTTDSTAYFYFEKGADNATGDLLGAGFASWKDSVESKKAKGNVGSL